MLRREVPEGGRARKTTGNIYNLNSFCLNWLEFEGVYNFPKLKRVDNIPVNLFPYDERNKWKEGDGAIHFYCHDTEFESVWLRAHLHPHIPAVVKKAGVTLAPDFSLFTDYPKAMQIWNVYRSRLLGALWSSLGIEVIPSVVWGTAESFDFCFDGLPSGGVLAVATTHVSKSEHDGFLLGFDEMLKRCKPDVVLVYGRGMRGLLEDRAPIKRYDSRLTQIYQQRKKRA